MQEDIFEQLPELNTKELLKYYYDDKGVQIHVIDDYSKDVIDVYLTNIFKGSMQLVVVYILLEKPTNFLVGFSF